MPHWNIQQMLCSCAHKALGCLLVIWDKMPLCQNFLFFTHDPERGFLGGHLCCGLIDITEHFSRYYKVNVATPTQIAQITLLYLLEVGIRDLITLLLSAISHVLSDASGGQVG